MNDVIILSKKHPIFTTVKEVVEICKPLTASLNTSYFNFVRRYLDGSEICLTTAPEWTEYFYLNKLYKHVLVDRLVQPTPQKEKIKIIPWTHFTDSPVRLAQSEQCGVGIGISFIVNHVDYIDYFHFGTKNEFEEMKELYPMHAERLINFIYFFYEKANRLLKDPHLVTNRLFLPDRRSLQDSRSLMHSSNFNIKRFLQDVNVKKIKIGTLCGEEVFLTRREAECCYWAMRGKTATKIGEDLFISKRTVESRLNNIRMKLNLPVGTNKADLFSEIFEGGVNFRVLSALFAEE
jgi:hypothetical protein